MKKLPILLLALCLTVFSACGAGGVPSTAPTAAPTASPEPTPEPDAAEMALAAMTTDQKIGQLFLVRPESLDPALTPEQAHNTTLYGATAVSEAMAQTLRDYPAGGVAVFGKNIVSPKQLKAFTAALQNASAVPLLLGIDEEGGSVSRIAGTTGFDEPRYNSAESVGATGDPAQAEAMGAAIGSYLAEYGFNLDFAPVADVNTNPKNIVIGSRAFGSDPALVAKMVSAEIAGLHRAGVMTCAKHYPGHGDTAGDTHDGYVSVTKTWDELKACELVPFTAAMDAGTDMIMAAHITAVNVTDDGLPASLSKEMITDRLRDGLGWNGVVITDALSMGAVLNNYSSADAAVKAVLAGADILLMPYDFKAAFNGVKDAVADGTISQARLDESVLRILDLKMRYGLLK